MMRACYTLVFYLLIPFIFIRLAWRSIKAPGYRQRWAERLGLYGKEHPQGVVWFHAVSVGEAEALFPVVRRFRQQSPDAKILITTTTPTGSARVCAVMGDSVVHVYLPYDVPFAVERFLSQFKPVLAVIVETEIWPNLFFYCGKHQIPLSIINARLSAKSARGYQRIPSLIHPTIANIKLIATQTQADSGRYAAIGARDEQLVTLGNIKFDLEVQPEIKLNGKTLKTTLLKNRFVWLAASTHRGEEELLLETYKKLKPMLSNLLLAIVPRHPERFDEVAGLCQQHNLNVVTRTSMQSCGTAADVYLVDTMGELKLHYAAADVAFIGGSLVSVGGHNLLEASAVGVPVLFGPYMANFQEIADKVLAADAAIQCEDQSTLIRVILQLYVDENRRKTLISHGMTFVEQNRGVVEKLVKLLSNQLSLK